MFDYVVVGAGFAGSVLSERITNVLGKKVLLIEKRRHIGGNCYDYKDENGIIVHKYGPHLFHTSDNEVFHYLSQFTQWNIYHHKVLAFVDGKKVPIPFNIHSIHELFPQSLANRLIEKLLQRFEYGSKVPILELQKENDEDLIFLSNFIYEKVFKNYTAKQWGKKPEELGEEVLVRVPIHIGKDDRYFGDRYQVVPKEGYTKIFERMLSSSNIKLLLGTDYKEVMKIDVQKKAIYLFNQKFKGKVIFTGKVDDLCDYRFGELPYRSLKLEFETVHKEYFQEVTTVNYPNDYDFTRITEFKHIHPVQSDKTTILKEYPKNYEKGDIPFYPLFIESAKEKYRKYKEFLSDFTNIILVGRLAEYRYYDMDDIVKRALQVFHQTFKER